MRPVCQLSFILPSIFTILICLNLVSIFPYGHLGVIFIFTVVHIGFATINIAESLKNKIGNLGLIAKIYNLKKMTFFYRIVLPLIKSDLLVLSLIIFLSCLSSLSIPLIAGGGKGTNLEVYIYEKIFIDQKWSEALWLALIQSAVLFIISFFVFQNKKVIQGTKSVFYAINLSSKTAALCLLSFILIYIASYLIKVASVFAAADLSVVFDHEFFGSFFNSVMLFINFSILFGIFIFFILYLSFRNIKINLMNIFLSPSTILIGFGLYVVLPVNHFEMDLFKITIGFFMLFSVGLYQAYLSAKIDSLANQMLLCRIYQIRYLTFVKDIFWPQAKNNILFLISLIYLISVSEFALVKAAGVQIQTVGTLTGLYLNSYRMDQAYLISFFSLLTWCLFYFCLRMFYERNQKS